MPFIGNQPALSYTSFAKQDFTTSATTSYTLDQPVANANELALFINFVRQEPTTAYTASGTSLTLTSATSASDDMYCVFLGKAVQTVNPPNGSVGTTQLADGQVTNAKLQNSSITLNGSAVSLGGSATVGGTNTPAFLVQGPSGGQSLSSGVWTKITAWDNVYDTASGFDFTNDKYTIPSGEGGKYFVYGFIKFANSASRRIQIAVYKNGSLVQGQSNNVDYYAGVYIGVALEFAAADYIEIYGKIDNGGGGTVMTDNTAERFGAFKIIE